MSIQIVLYRMQWPDEFQAIAAELRRALGPLALRIDHIGSTSVPGLAAKDIIDIQVTAADLSLELEQALASIGYRRRVDNPGDHIPPAGPDDPEHWAKWYFDAPAGQRPTHLHVRAAGRANQRYPLLFRDYLRADRTSAEAYSRVKIALARLHPDDVDAYYAVKDPACDLILAAAELWARESGWQQGPSDG